MYIFITSKFWILSSVMTATIWPAMQTAVGQMNAVVGTDVGYSSIIETTISSLGPSIVVAWAILKQAWSREMRMSDRINLLEDRAQLNVTTHNELIKELNLIIEKLRSDFKTGVTEDGINKRVTK